MNAKRLLSRLVPALLAGAVTMALFAPSSEAVVLPTAYVTLRGEGAWSVVQEIVPWKNELATAKSSITLTYGARGSYFGRADFLAGDADFAISGVPFTAAELKGVKGGAAAFIDAPIQVATLATFVEPPVGGFNNVKVLCDPDDPDTWLPGMTDGSIECIVRQTVQGRIKIPNRNLAAMFFGVPGPGVPRLNNWNSPAIKAAMGVDDFDVGLDPNAVPGIAGRSDPDEINYYLQTFAKAVAPDVWQQIKQVYPASWDPITERIPVPAGVTRDGAEQQVDQLAQGGNGVGLGSTAGVQGGIAPAPPSTIRSFLSTFGAAAINLASVQNANGDWVPPEPAGINAAVDAGGDSPLYALTHKVPGAYPLVWVDRLYAPAHGLSIEKTEGLATLIRYLATTGQEKAAPVGEGRLSTALVEEALNAADQLVVSNCVGADRKVVLSFDPGPLVPASATALKAIGPAAHCEAVPAAPTTTSSTTPTTVSTTPTVPVGPTDSGSDFVPDTGSPVVSGSDSTGNVSDGTTNNGASPTGATTSTSAPAQLTGLLTASKLPLPAPAGATASDRLGAFLLGAALYLLLRKPVARLAGKIST